MSAPRSALPEVRPVVAIVCDKTEFHKHPGHLVLNGYVKAVQENSRAFVVLIPANQEGVDVATLVASIDGLVLTGSPSNVEPERYGSCSPPGLTGLDRDRDATVFSLLPDVLAAGIPVLAICRGLQEMNVAHGGTLHTAVHTLPGHLDHRECDHANPIQQWYADSHEVNVVPGGRLAKIIGTDKPQKVNSLHHQGIDRLGDGLQVEAVAPDGLVEAFSIAGIDHFNLAVQWHPEMRTADSALSQSIFGAFGDACRERNAMRLKGMSAR